MYPTRTPRASDAERRFVLHDGQARAYASERRFVAMCCGTGGGKTWVGPLWLIREIEKHPGGEFIIAAPTFKTLRNATMPSFMRQVAGTEWEGEYKESKGHYILPTGGIIYCISMEDPLGNEGIHANAAWGDESGRWSLMAWVVLQARLGQKMGRCFLTTTPYGLNWLFTDFYKRWKGGDHDYDVIQFASTANPYYPAEEFERAKRSMSEGMFAMRYGGQFVRMEGLIFAELLNCVVDELPGDLKGELIGGLDAGFHHPFARTHATLNDDDVLWLTDVYRQANKTTPEHAKALDRRYTYVGDPSAAQDWHDMGQLGYYIVTHSPDGSQVNAVEYGISTVIERARTGRLKILRSGCQPLLDECETYHRDERGKPVKISDDACDTVRYISAWLAGRAAYSAPIVPSRASVVGPETIKGSRIVL